MFRVFYSDADTGAAGSAAPANSVPAAAAPEAAPAAGQNAAAGQAAPFEFTYGDQRFSSPEELTAWVDRSTLQKRGHDNAARELAQRQRQFEQQQQQYEQQLQQLQQRDQEYRQVQAAIMGNPQTQQWFQQQFRRQATPQDMRTAAQYDTQEAIAQALQEQNQRFQPILEQYEEYQNERLRNEAIDQAGMQLGQQVWPQVEQAVRADIERLAQAPDETWVTELALMLGRLRASALPGAGQDKQAEQLFQLGQGPATFQAAAGGQNGAGVNGNGTQQPPQQPPQQRQQAPPGTRRPSGSAGGQAAAPNNEPGSIEELRMRHQSQIANRRPSGSLFGGG